MDLCVYPDPFSDLTIAGSVDALAGFAQKLSDLQHMKDGYLDFTVVPKIMGDMTAVEVCMMDRIPIICTKVYRGKPEQILDKLFFPSMVRLGAFKCDVSSFACNKISYSLLPAEGEINGTTYQVPDIICKHCGRDVSYISYQDYLFASLKGGDNSKKQSVEFNINDFVHTSRKRMRIDLELNELCTMRVWRKGPSTAVFEVTQDGITDLVDNCITPLLSDPETQLHHVHYYHLAREGKLDYTELLVKVEDIEEYKQAEIINNASYDRYLIVSWITCMNLRCAHRFLVAEYSYDIDNPTSKNYREIHSGISSCPICRSSYYVSHSAFYRKQIEFGS